MKLTVRGILYLGIPIVLSLSGIASATNYPMGQPTTGLTGPITRNYTFGWRFQCRSTNVIVTQLGNYIPASSTGVTLALWSDSGTQLAVVTPSSLGGGSAWVWTTLSSPVALTQNSYYRVSEHSTMDYYFARGSWAGDSNIAAFSQNDRSGLVRGGLVCVHQS